MKINDKKRVIIAGLIPMIILISMTIIPLYTIFYGEEILLETIPYDPRDIFRGDYVTLSYKIDEVSIEKFPEVLRDEEAQEEYLRKDIYAVLKKKGDFYTVDYMTYKEPKDKVYLTSKITYFYPFMENRIDEDEIDRKIHMNYNLDKYFVPENTGKELEDMSRKGELVARIKVYNGYAILTEIFPKDL